ncbi:MAG: hypothetical protein QOE68_3540 [Thermoanaerobaculia bacterium]|jgi:hypothetical protein|nr:hypothetical protein [Thermoanaerobaculia bacterium]
MSHEQEATEPDTALEMQKLREIVSIMLDKARDGELADAADAVQRAADILKLPLDLERARAELKKLALEQSKLDRETQMTYLRERSERVTAMVSVITPLLSIITVAGTLMFQTWQFRQTEAATRKAAEQSAISTRTAAEEASWSSAMAGPLDSQNSWPKVLAVVPFLRSPVHAKEARSTLLHVMVETTDAGVFDELFARLFPAPDWSNIDEVLRLVRGLTVKAFQVYGKSWDEKRNSNDLDRLSDSEKMTDNYVGYVLPKLGAVVGSVLRTTRPKNQKLDLSSTLIKNCDWRGTSLRDAQTESMTFRRVDIDDSDLSVADVHFVSFQWTAWWKASVISPNLRRFLRTHYPCKSSETYGLRDEVFTKDQCKHFNEQ